MSSSAALTYAEALGAEGKIDEGKAAEKTFVSRLALVAASNDI
jgi:hypothetical protein